MIELNEPELQSRRKVHISDVNNCQTIIECLLMLRQLIAFCEMSNTEMLRLHKTCAMAKPKLKKKIMTSVDPLSVKCGSRDRCAL